MGALLAELGAHVTKLEGGELASQRAGRFGCKAESFLKSGPGRML